MAMMALIFGTLTPIFTFRFIYREYCQLIRAGVVDYFNDQWNLIDVTYPLLLL
jgi:hypothetical protein